MLAIFFYFKVIHKAMKEIAYNAISHSWITEFASFVSTLIIIPVIVASETSNESNDLK